MECYLHFGWIRSSLPSAELDEVSRMHDPARGRCTEQRTVLDVEAGEPRTIQMAGDIIQQLHLQPEIPKQEGPLKGIVLRSTCNIRRCRGYCQQLRGGKT